MISLPPPPPGRQFSVSRVWRCSSCGYLAKNDISSAACLHCGHIGHEESNVGDEPSSRRPQTEAQGVGPDSASSEIVQQDPKTLGARSLDLSTLFITATEDSSNIVMTIRSYLGADLSVAFGEFLLFGTIATGYLIKARRPIAEQEMTDLENSLNSALMDNFAAEDKLPYPHLRPHDSDGMLASISTTLGSKVEQHEDWEIVDQSSHDGKDLRAASNNMSAPDMRPSDLKALEPLDTRYSLITKPQRFFKIGRVFMTLWSEPASSSARDGPNFSFSSIGARIFSETRRFVVVRSGHGYALCCPIQTYQKRGTTKSRISVEHHAIVYAAGSEPTLLAEEEWPSMGKFPITVEDKSVTIDLSSRLNFGKVYTVEHNIKVRNIGKISKESLPRLKTALIMSMGLNASDGEVETGTESEDNMSRPAPIASQPSSHSGSKTSSSGSKSSSKGASASSGRQSTFFIRSEGIDREVITADICRYLGNDALIKPGVYTDSKTGRVQEGFFITAYRAPTSAQLADLKDDSQKWREERARNSARVTVGYDQSATRQAAMMGVFTYEPSQPRGGYTLAAYAQIPPLQPSLNYTGNYGPSPGFGTIPRPLARHYALQDNSSTGHDATQIPQMPAISDEKMDLYAETEIV